MMKSVDDTVVDARLKAPLTLICSGASMSGKSTFTRNLLLNSHRLVDVPFDYAVVFSGSRDQTLKNLATDYPIEFVDGLPAEFDNYIDNSRHGLFVFDDLESKAVVSQNLMELFSVKSHHENLSVVLNLQNLFSKGSERISMLRNAGYLCLFRSPLDQSIMWTIARRIDPSKSRSVMTLMSSVLDRYGYILITGKPHSPKSLRFRTDIFNPHYQRCFLLT